MGIGPWDDDLKNIETSYLGNGGEFLVAETGTPGDQRIIGMGAFRRIDHATTEIKRMRVYREFQGKGIGKSILLKLEERACELGYKILTLDTTSLQPIAQRLYRGFGYHEVQPFRYGTRLNAGWWERGPPHAKNSIHRSL